MWQRPRTPPAHPRERKEKHELAYEKGRHVRLTFLRVGVTAGVIALAAAVAPLVAVALNSAPSSAATSYGMYSESIVPGRPS